MSFFFIDFKVNEVLTYAIFALLSGTLLASHRVRVKGTVPYICNPIHTVPCPVCCFATLHKYICTCRYLVWLHLNKTIFKPEKCLTCHNDELPLPGNEWMPGVSFMLTHKWKLTNNVVHNDQYILSVCPAHLCSVSSCSVGCQCG